MDNYLRLEPAEEEIFNSEMEKIEPKEREKIMAITTTWEEKGKRIELIESTLEVLEHQITELDSFIQDRVKGLDNSELKALRKAAWNMKTMEELKILLNQKETNSYQTMDNQTQTELDNSE